MGTTNKNNTSILAAFGGFFFGMAAEIVCEKINNRKKEVRKLINSLRESTQSLCVLESKEIVYEEIDRNDISLQSEDKKIHSLDSEQSNNIISFLSGSGVSVALAKLSTRELLKCNVPIGMLTKAKDGSGMLGSVINNGRISENARFNPAGMTSVSPLLFFQAMSMVTGQYYLHTITKQLTKINDNVAEIIEYYENNRNAKIQTIYQKMVRYCKYNDTDFMEQDIDQLFDFENSLKTVINEYNNPIDVLDNISDKVLCYRMIEQLNVNYNNMVNRYVLLAYSQYLLVLVYFNMTRALSALKKPSDRTTEVFDELGKSHDLLLKRYNDFYREQNKASVFMSKISRFADYRFKTKKSITEFERIRARKIITSLDVVREYCQLECVFFIEKKSDVSFSVLTQ